MSQLQHQQQQQQQQQHQQPQQHQWQHLRRVCGRDQRCPKTGRQASVDASASDWDSDSASDSGYCGAIGPKA
ncbi:hypothetical protein AWZ03_001095 [Drosophila navojoa]|uniref:Uncharacterized protein n=1 Tax=Drosophila navojoa TaxID=7232 RepID=A0A484BWF5_DRONA|nr:hypothetical protein AWZ03_001095 [Drosophila navojoa]